jgi:UDP-N-acetylmuramoylalanine--D-glutamate ligase
MTTLFFERCPGPIVGVTGSSGKTTTTGLIGHILRCAGREAVVGGNIGDPMLDLLDVIGPQTVVVLELSSFQLSLLRQSPHIAVVTNISPNHLDRHGTMADYVAAKRHIVEHQSPGDYAVLNVRDETAPEFARATPAQLRWFGSPAGSMSAGATTRAGQIGLVDGATFMAVMACADVPLLGRHNVENVLAALAATAVLEIEPEAMAAAVPTYRPAPHRLQPVGDRDGVLYIDDSIATSPARALVALEAIDAPILLIAGGRDKKLPWDEFAEMVVQKARALLLIGESAPIIERAVRARIGATSRLSENAILRCESLWEAVSSASRMAVPGEVVLLSPGCASYDMFRDFEERGTLFIRAVEALNVA